MNNLRELKDKLSCFNFSMKLENGKLQVFKLNKSVEIKEVKAVIRQIFGAGYTKLFNLEENTSSRYTFVVVSEKQS
jgi:hypothetical protein